MDNEKSPDDFYKSLDTKNVLRTDILGIVLNSNRSLHWSSEDFMWKIYGLRRGERLYSERLKEIETVKSELLNEGVFVGVPGKNGVVKLSRSYFI